MFRNKILLNNAEYSTVNKYWIQILNVFFNKITKKRLNKKNTANKYSSILSNARHQPFFKTIQNKREKYKNVTKCSHVLKNTHFSEYQILEEKNYANFLID